MGRQRPQGAVAPSLRGLAKIYDFRLGECPKYQRHPLSHGVRRDSAPRGGAKVGFADGACFAKQQFTIHQSCLLEIIQKLCYV